MPELKLDFGLNIPLNESLIHEPDQGNEQAEEDRNEAQEVNTSGAEQSDEKNDSETFNSIYDVKF